MKLGGVLLEAARADVCGDTRDDQRIGYAMSAGIEGQDVRARRRLVLKSWRSRRPSPCVDKLLITRKDVRYRRLKEEAHQYCVWSVSTVEEERFKLAPTTTEQRDGDGEDGDNKSVKRCDRKGLGLRVEISFSNRSRTNLQASNHHRSTVPEEGIVVMAHG